MSRIRISLVLTSVAGLLGSAPALAEMIFGTIHQNGQPLANASLKLECPWGVIDDMTTDGNGGYRLVTSQAGSCTLTVSTGGGSASASVDFYDDPARYDFELSGTGQLLLR